MGIRFLDSILVLVAAAAVVLTAYFVGHALSSDHAGWAWLTAGALLIVGVGIGFLSARRIRAYARERGEPLHD